MPVRDVSDAREKMRAMSANPNQPTLRESMDDDTIFEKDMRSFRKAMFKWMAVSWMMVPVGCLAPLWNAIHARPHEPEWVGFAVLAVLLIPLWYITGRLVWVVHKVFGTWDGEEDEIYEARRVKRELLIRRGERLERSKARLAATQAKKDAEAHARLALKVDRIRRELDGDDGNDG